VKSLKAALTPTRLLILAELTVIVATALVTVARLPVWSPIDERAHYAYVEHVARHGTPPVMGRSLVPVATAAIGDGAAAQRAFDARPRPLQAYSYEAFQPPLYYYAAAPVRVVAGGGITGVRALRLLGMALLLAAAWALWLLTREIAGPEDAEGVYALALVVLMFPASVVRTVTVSNAAPELLLGTLTALALWRGRERESGRWLLCAGALCAVGVATRLTFLPFLPVLAVVALAGARRSGWRRAAIALALPAVFLAPWVASNYHRYGSATASAQVRRIIEPAINPTHHDYGFSDVRSGVENLSNFALPEEWFVELLGPGHETVSHLSGLLFFGGPLLFAFALGAALRRRALLILGAPLGLGVAMMIAGMYAGNWNYFYPRYLMPVLVGYGLLGALGLRAAAGPRASLAVGSLASVAVVALWIHLATVTPFAP
jgi:4-amino-4-deoxy-L-arabinose transferase-like glycosyltransferase